MKITVEVDIDWINEDGTIDDFDSNEIKEKLALVLADRMKEDSRDTLTAKTERMTREWLYEWLRDNALVLHDPYSKVTVKERIEQSIAEFMGSMHEADGVESALDRIIAQRLLMLEDMVNEKIASSVRRYFGPAKQIEMEENIVNELKKENLK